jgi:hypothetical protein
MRYQAGGWRLGAGGLLGVAMAMLLAVPVAAQEAAVSARRAAAVVPAQPEVGPDDRAPASAPSLPAAVLAQAAPAVPAPPAPRVPPAPPAPAAQPLPPAPPAPRAQPPAAPKAEAPQPPPPSEPGAMEALWPQPKRNIRLTVTVVGTEGKARHARTMTTVVAEAQRTQVRSGDGARHFSVDAQAVVTPENRILADLRLGSSFPLTVPEGRQIVGQRGFNQEIKVLLDSGVSQRITTLDDASGEFGVTVEVVAEVVK